MRKRIDERIRTLIENGVKTRHRSMFVIIGDKSLDQIVNLHYMLSKAQMKSKPTMLWCYNHKLQLSSKKEKRHRQIQKLRLRGLLDHEKVDAFSLFMETKDITYCLYKDSEKILGNTFGMCILQDFETLTPNLLARTIETVEGGGLIVLLLGSLSSLTSLYTMVMDVHKRFRTESHSEAAGRFNERFLLSIASCKACLVMDDEMNILPISSHIRSITPVLVNEDAEGLSKAKQGLKKLKEQLSENYLVGLIRKCCTLDQGHAVVTFLDAILSKTLRGTVALLAGRGCGKSAALGLSIAGAIAAGYSNIFVTAPSPDNLKTLFEFILIGFEALDYKVQEHINVVKSGKNTVRINIYKHEHHIQTIQYILPHEHEKLSLAELLVVDEAAAIPLSMVKSLLGPYLVFLSSTVNGYEGTGHSLTLKLLHQLEAQSNTFSKSTEGTDSGYLFKKIELSESIRYASGDPIESWLNKLLCLDVSNAIPNLSSRFLPPCSECDLYYVNRDTLFSYHRDSELFLQRMMALYVASDYKNSPNDIQLMADAPAHHLFVLLGPVDESKNQLPDILCVIQVSLEGQISRQSVKQSLSNGHIPSGDQIPWKFCEQYQDTVFPSLSGARIVRIATHPDDMKHGYGSQAVELLIRYYEGQLTPISGIDVDDEVQTSQIRVTEAAEKVSLLEENIKPRKELPHLLVHLRERRPEKLHYIGVSFGLTLDLFRFWRKLKFAPFYISQIPNTVTGEHSIMVLKPLNNDEIKVDGSNQWGFVSPFYQDFRQRFFRLLASNFRGMEFKLAMSILDPKINFEEQDPSKTASHKFMGSVREYLSPHDMKRLKAYVSNFADFNLHLILDLVPILARLYFEEKLPVKLSYVQASVLLCIGLQNHNILYIEGQMKLERQQLLSEFRRIMKLFYNYLNGLASKEIESTLPRMKEIVMEPHSVSVDDDLNNAAKQVEDGMKLKAEAPVTPELLQRYAIVEGESDLETVLQNNRGKIPIGGLISVKSSSKPEMMKRSRKNDKKRTRFFWSHNHFFWWNCSYNHKLSKRRRTIQD
ncbi:RNA cytidine acetyltransferase 1 [Glycine soja]